jgi:hypothetical protein
MLEAESLSARPYTAMPVLPAIFRMGNGQRTLPSPGLASHPLPQGLALQGQVTDGQSHGDVG